MIQFLFIFLIGFSSLFAQDTLVISKDGDSFDNFKVEMYEDSSTTLSLSEVQKIQNFNPYNNRISLGYSDSAFWFRFKLKNATLKELTYFSQFTENMADELDFYIIKESGQYILHKAGVSTYTQSNSQHKKPRFEINLQSGEVKTIYFRLVGKYSNFTSIKVLNQESLDSYNKVYDRYYIFYFGAIFSLLLYKITLSGERKLSN